MSLGPVMVDLVGLEPTVEECEMLRDPAVGGVILFGRNYESPQQLEALTATIHALRHPKLLIGIDQEGGRVQRCRDGFTRLPPVAAFGALYDQDQRHARHLAQQAGWLMAAELRAVGVDLSFAPVLDLDYGVSPVIGDRAFHANPVAVAELAGSYIRGMRSAGMAGTGKHFPGHGAVTVDSHLALPIDQRPLATIEALDMEPYRRLLGHELNAVMAAHVVYQQVDAMPAGFSPRWLKDILRGSLGFEGAIFSDDLSMQGAAVAGPPADRARVALAAGCDMVLVCNQPETIPQVLDAVRDHVDPAAHLRLARMHGAHAPNRERLPRVPQWARAREELGSALGESFSLS